MRAFARDLKISPSRLSEVLSRRHHLSASMAESVGANLGFKDKDLAYFKDLVESQTGRSESLRHQARLRLLKHSFADAKTALKLDEFKAISAWYHFAILELFKTRGFSDDPQWIARTLRISSKTAKSALLRLERLRFIEKKQATYQLRRGRTFTDSDTPQAALRDYHRQIFERAVQALHTQTKAERVTLSAVAAIDSESVDTLRTEIKALIDKFVTRSAKQRDADHVYCMTVQLFKLDEGLPPL